MKPAIFDEIRMYRWKYCNNVFKYSNIIAIWIFYFKKKKKTKTMNLSPSKSMQDQVSIVWPFLSLSLPLFRLFLFFRLNRMNNIALSAFHRVPRRNAEKHYHEFSVQSISLLNDTKITTPFVQLLFFKWMKTWIQLNRFNVIIQTVSYLSKCRHVWNLNKWISLPFWRALTTRRNMRHISPPHWHSARKLSSQLFSYFSAV